MTKQSAPVRKRDNGPVTSVSDSDRDASEIARLTNEVQRLLKENKQRNAELAIISSVQKGLVAKLEFQSIIDLVGDQIHAITNAKSISIALYDKVSGMISWPYWFTLGKRLEIPDRPMEKSITRQVMYADKPLNLGTEEEILTHDAIPPQDGWTVGKSFLGVPFTVGNTILGALSLHDFDNEHAFDESDERLLQTLANSMSLALENARLFDETEQRAAEFQIINSVQDGLASKLDMQAIYDLVGDKIREIFHNMDAEIRIHDPKTNLIHIPYITDMGKRIVVDPLPFTDFGISSYVLRTGQTLVINENILQEMEKYGSKLVPGGHQAKSAVFVPLIVNHQARGLLVLGDVEHEHAFSESDVRLLQTLANSMSTALENAHLFDETQHLLNETEQRAAELAIINSVQEGLASQLDVQAIYDLVGDKIRDIFHAQGTAIYLFDHKTEILDTPYCYLKKRFEIESRPFSEHPIAKLMVHTLQPITYRNLEEYRAVGGGVLENSEEYKSGMYVPLIVGKELKGMVGIANLDKENAYNDSDLRLLQTLANSMSVALENARLFDEVQKKNVEITEALERETASNNILRVIAESPTDIQPVLNVIARNAAQLSGLDDAIITLRAGNILRVDAHYGDIPTFPIGEGLPFNRDSVAGRAILEGRPRQAIHNQHGVKSEYPEGDKVARKYGYRMSCAVPLMREGKAIGAISIRRIKPELLTEKQIALIQPFANQAAIAVENVRLFNETTRLLKETEQRAAELAIINSVQEGLASKLDMQAIYDLVGDKIRDLLNAGSVWIITFDPPTRTRRVRYSFENGQRYYTSELFPYNKLTEHLIATKKPLVINQNFLEAIARFEMIDMAGTQGQIKSIAYIPIIAGEEVKGFISLPNRERENAFSEADVNLLSTFASSMSIALENIRLFDETRRLLKEAEQRAAELAIINSIQEGLASKLDMQAIYDLVGDKLRDLFNTQAILIVTLDPANRTREIKYFCETGERYYTSELFSYNQLTEYLIATKKTLVINQDAEAQIAELGMVVISKTFKSAVFVPLIAGGEVKGFITIQNLEQENAFSDSDVNLLSTFAASMSVALENARLFDETQRLLKETEQANQAKSAFLSSMSHELRTPLNAIINFVEMVARGMIGPVSQEQVELLDQALHSSKHLLNLINDVLDISKIQAGQLVLFIEDQVSVQVEMEAALSILGGLLQEKNLHLIRDIDPHLPMISCDRRRLRQVLLNLISNAIKFTNAGTVTVSVKDQGREVMFAVIDTGPGIPQNKVDLIFEPFLQAENGERGVQGTGLGLPISRSLVRAHGGELWVDSQPGEGSIFYFTLPVKRRSAP